MKELSRSQRILALADAAFPPSDVEFAYLKLLNFVRSLSDYKTPYSEDDFQAEVMLFARETLRQIGEE